jgi:hypothetical protein
VNTHGILLFHVLLDAIRANSQMQGVLTYFNTNHGRCLQILNTLLDRADMLSRYDMENTEAHYIKAQCEQTIDTVQSKT